MITFLKNRFPGSSVRAFHSDAGWIVELVHPDVKTQRMPIAVQLQNDLQNLPRTVEKDITWKAFLYADNSERFKGHGTLHTLREEYDNGMEVVTLAGDDCYVDLTEYDSEILSFTPRSGLEILGRESRTSAGTPVLAFQASAKYLWLEALGGHYEIDRAYQAGADDIRITLR